MRSEEYRQIRRLMSMLFRALHECPDQPTRQRRLAEVVNIVAEWQQDNRKRTNRAKQPEA